MCQEDIKQGTMAEQGGFRPICANLQFVEPTVQIMAYLEILEPQFLVTFTMATWLTCMCSLRVRAVVLMLDARLRNMVQLRRNLRGKPCEYSGSEKNSKGEPIGTVCHV